jgi:hypothetical protein
MGGCSIRPPDRWLIRWPNRSRVGGGPGVTEYRSATYSDDFDSGDWDSTPRAPFFSSGPRRSPHTGSTTGAWLGTAAWLPLIVFGRLPTPKRTMGSLAARARFCRVSFFRGEGSRKHNRSSRLPCQDEMVRLQPTRPVLSSGKRTGDLIPGSGAMQKKKRHGPSSVRRMARAVRLLVWASFAGAEAPWSRF